MECEWFGGERHGLASELRGDFRLKFLCLLKVTVRVCPRLGATLCWKLGWADGGVGESGKNP